MRCQAFAAFKVENLEFVGQHLGTLLFPAGDGARVLPRDCPIDLESCLTTSNQLLLRSYRFGQVLTYRHSSENACNFSLSLDLRRSTWHDNIYALQISVIMILDAIWFSFLFTPMNMLDSTDPLKSVSSSK